MHTATWLALYDELEKIAAGALTPSLSMGGLAGLTGLEAAQVFNKKKTKKERVLAGAGAASTGAILASEAIHNKDLLKSGFSKLKGLAKRMPKHAAVPLPASMKKLMRNDAMSAAAKAATTGVQRSAKAIGSLTNNTKRAPMLQSFMASGGHAFKPDPSRALSL